MNFNERMNDAIAALSDCAKAMQEMSNQQMILTARISQLETELHAVKDREQRIAKIFQESLTNGY